jgi:hypothetical protein
MVGRRQAEDQESLGFLREAETIELDRVFPADPFARWATTGQPGVMPGRRASGSCSK